jgi:hypothetical protein
LPECKIRISTFWTFPIATVAIVVASVIALESTVSIISSVIGATSVGVPATSVKITSFLTLLFWTYTYFNSNQTFKVEFPVYVCNMGERCVGIS